VTHRTIAIIAVLLLLQFGQTAVAEAQGSDFGFRYEVMGCFPETFDSFSGTFVKKLGIGPADSATLNLSLTDAQMRMIDLRVENVHFFDYPSQYSGVPPGTTEVMTISPRNTYRLDVRSNGRAHTVEWTDGFRPQSDDGVRFRELLSMIAGFIHDQPEFKRLPAPRIGANRLTMEFGKIRRTSVRRQGSVLPQVVKRLD